MAPPVTIIIYHNKLYARPSWEPHVQPGCYLGPEINITTDTKFTLIKQDQHESMTLWNFPRRFTMPCMSSEYAADQAAQDLIHALEKLAPAAPYNTIGT